MDCSISGQHQTDAGGAVVARLIRNSLIAMLALGLVACGGYSRKDPPAQVEERGTPPETQAGSTTQIAAYTPPAAPRVARPQPNRAVTVLMRRADDQRRAGDLDAATVSLERALRIAPDDAMLWHRLAEVRLAQQRYSLVVQLASKSNALALPADRDLRARNWRLIAAARRGLGDSRGARDAEQRAASL